MSLKSFIQEVLRLLLYSMFPVFVLYSNFVFLGVNVLGPSMYSQEIVVCFFIIFKVFLTFSILYFVLLTNTDGKSTKDMFPLASDFETDRNFKSINPFIADYLLEKSIEKTHICNTCKTYKPPRCHHCSRCNKCFLKYDHHCAYLDICVGFHNYKFFIQFLVANLCYIAFYILVTTTEFFKIHRLSPSITINVIASLIFACGIFIVTLQTLLVQIKLLANNETYVEFCALNEYLQGDHSYIHVFQEGPISEFSDSKDRKVLNPYNLGLKNNLQEVFGTKLFGWISPSFTSIGDGISFKKNYDDN